MRATQAQFDVGGMACSFCAGSIRPACEGVDDVTTEDTLRDLGYTIRDPRQSGSRSNRRS